MSEDAEHNRLDAIARDSKYALGVNTPSIQYAFGIFKRFLRPGPILEMGPAEGVMTDELVQLGQPLTVVEGAEDFCTDLRARHPQITVVHSLFEDFAPQEKFSTIVLGNVLEHVQDPVPLIRRAGEFLSPGGRIFSYVPNARSLHRQAGVILGQLPFEEELNELDLHHGHRRIYNPETFRRDFNLAGLTIEAFGGYWLKPLSNAQLEAHWSPELIQAYFALGERHPDISASIYVVATTGRKSA